MAKTNTDRFHGRVESKLESIECDVSELKESVKELRSSVSSLNNKFLILAILLTVAVIERLPNLVGMVLAF